MSCMQTTQDKFTLVCKPEQSGKTFVMIQEIIKYLTPDDAELDGKIVINIIFCDNNLLLTKQTSERLDKDLKSFTDNGETYVEFSSRKGNEHRSSDAIFSAIARGVTKNIICCTNGKRVSDISDLVKNLNTSLMSGRFAFRVWLDEADKFTTHITNTFIPLAASCNNVHVSLLTATPDQLFKKYKEMDVYPLDEVVQPSYHGWKDNHIVKLDNAGGSCVDFVSEVLSGERHLIQPGTKWYIPAERRKKSHDAVFRLCVGHGMAVFIVNGDGLTLERPGMASVTEEKVEELNKQIMKMYADYGLHKFAVAITGNICVSRGISIMSPDFIFDYGILSTYKNKAEASQSAGRLKGNIKGWANYKPPTVFTTEKFDAVATSVEDSTRRLAGLAFDRHEAGESTVITKSEYSNIDDRSDSCEYIIHPDLFDTMKAVKEFLARPAVYEKMGDTKPSRPHGIKKALRDQCSGYAVSARLPRGAKKMSDLVSEDRLTVEMANAITSKMCISGGSAKTCKVLVLPVYESIETPANQEKYQLRYRCES